MQGSRFCTIHNSKDLKQQYASPDNRKSSRQRGYDTRWDRLRDLKRKQDPLCEMCKQAGRYKPAEMVHHIVPINKGGSLLAWDNLMSLCKDCHERIHANQVKGNSITGMPTDLNHPWNKGANSPEIA